MSSYMRRRWRSISGTSSGVACRMSTLRVIFRAPVSCSGICRDKQKESRASLGRTAEGGRAYVVCAGYGLLMLGIFFGQLHFGGFQFFLHTGQVVLIDFGGYGLVPLRYRPLPVRRCQLQASRLLVKIAEVILDRRVGTNPLRSFDQR